MVRKMPPHIVLPNGQWRFVKRGKGGKSTKRKRGGYMGKKRRGVSRTSFGGMGMVKNVAIGVGVGSILGGLLGVGGAFVLGGLPAAAGAYFAPQIKGMISNVAKTNGGGAW